MFKINFLLGQNGAVSSLPRVVCIVALGTGAKNDSSRCTFEIPLAVIMKKSVLGGAVLLHRRPVSSTYIALLPGFSTCVRNMNVDTHKTV
jgi:hypothetical protein